MASEERGLENCGTFPSALVPAAQGEAPFNHTRKAESKGRIYIIKGVIVPFRGSNPFVLLSNHFWQFLKRLKNLAQGDISAEGKKRC